MTASLEKGVMLANLHSRWSFVMVGVLALVSGCSQAIATQQAITPRDSDQYWPTESWRSSTPEQQGMDSMILAAMVDTIQREDYNIDSVTVIRNGYLVADVAVYPFDQDMKHIIHSCTKSIVSLLIGIAIDLGYIEGVHMPVLDIFSERTVDNLDANKEKVKLENLLMMTTGFRCRDSYLYRWSGLNQMRQSGDWIQFMLDLPMEETPGIKFEYCNGSSFLLSAIITETTGMSALEFAEQHLFAPLGITDVSWPANPQGINIGWGELRMRPHDVAKIGYLYLREGEWNGEQIVSNSWVEDSTREHIAATLEDGYGYQWWVDDSGLYMALGYAGQFIFVVPDKEMVVVFMSDLSESDFYVPQMLLTDFIIPAAISSEPIPQDQEAQASLQQRIEILSNP